jgi:hypothetical protein
MERISMERRKGGAYTTALEPIKPRPGFASSPGEDEGEVL